MNSKQTAAIRKILNEWYLINKRTLPWRETKDPYKIWISEIILQQTRVNQGLDYYNRFIERFPDVKSLAEAGEDEVLKYWQGLGYYSRARNLHKAAKQIMNKYNGAFPTVYHEVLSLSGVGEYTAAAVCSLAYHQPYAVVDGNVYRVLSRLTGSSTPIDTSVGKKEFSALAKQLLNIAHPDTHNQAMMDFGALQCTPANPDCEICVLQDFCEAYKLNIVGQLPVKQGKTNVKNRYFNYFFIKNDDYTYLKKRTGKDIWQNLYEFPLIETDKEMNFQELTETESFRQLFGETELTVQKISHPVKHILSHRIINAVFYKINISHENETIKDFEKLLLSELNQFPVSRLTELYLEKG